MMLAPAFALVLGFATTPEPGSDLFAGYAIYDRFTDSIPADCVYEAVTDMGTQVPDYCCTDAPSPAVGALPFSPAENGIPGDDYSDYTCAPLAVFPDPAPYIRSYLGCVDSSVQFGELCVPADLEFGTTYPMTTDMAATKYTNDVDSAATCGCQAVYSGPGCYSAAQPFLLLANGSPEVYFAHISGTC